MDAVHRREDDGITAPRAVDDLIAGTFSDDLLGYAAPPPHPHSARNATTGAHAEKAEEANVTSTARSRGTFVVNTVACNGKSAKDLFSAVASELRWREVDVEHRASVGGFKKSTRATIYCVMQTSDMLERLPSMSRHSWVTRYIGLPDLCEKGTWSRMVLACQGFFEANMFSFNPKTWVLPDQLEALQSVLHKSKRTYIVKPEDGSQGDGIFLVQGLRDLEVKLSTKANKAAVVQRYIEKPLLLHGVKFDFRLYVVLIGGSAQSPPFVFLCREGLARFCTEVYEEPSGKNLHKSMAHLTNYSLNKRSDKFEHGAETAEQAFDTSTSASKRPLSTALRQIKEEHAHFDIEGFFQAMVLVVQRTISLMAPALTAFYRVHASDSGECKMNSVQLLGFDVMLDRDFAPYLLEVNNSPSLCIDEALPLDPGEPGADERGGRPGRPREKDKVCVCMDMQQPHRHHTSLVDLAVKSKAMGGVFRLLERFAQGVDPPEVDSFMQVEVRNDPVYMFLRRIEMLFWRSGGAQKAFTSSGLRRSWGSVCGTGGLEKHDLDAIAGRFRGTQFVSHDRSVKPDALRLFDYAEALRQASSRAFPGLEPRDAVERFLSALGA